MGNCCKKVKSTDPVRLVRIRSYANNVDISFENDQVEIMIERQGVPVPLKTSEDTKKTDSTQSDADDTVLKERILDCMRRARKRGKQRHLQAWAPSAPSSTVAGASVSTVKPGSDLTVAQLLDVFEQLGMLTKKQGRIHDLISALSNSKWSPLAFFLFRHKETHALFVDRLETEAHGTADDKRRNEELVHRVFSQWQRLLPQIDAVVQEERALGEPLSLETLE